METDGFLVETIQLFMGIAPAPASENLRFSQSCGRSLLSSCRGELGLMELPGVSRQRRDLILEKLQNFLCGWVWCLTATYPNVPEGNSSLLGVETRPVHVDGQMTFRAADLTHTQAISRCETGWGSPGSLVCGVPASCCAQEEMGLGKRWG